MNQDIAGGATIQSPPSSQPSGGVTKELADDAKGIGKAAQEKLSAKANEGKEQAGEAARSTATALKSAADQLQQDGSSPEWLTTGFQKAAREIERFASGIEGKDMRAITRDVTQFARSNPLAFLAVAGIAGFAAARVLRAGSDYREDSPTGSGTQSLGIERSPAGTSNGDRSSFNWDSPSSPGAGANLGAGS